MHSVKKETKKKVCGVAHADKIACNNCKKNIPNSLLNITTDQEFIVNNDEFDTKDKETMKNFTKSEESIPLAKRFSLFRKSDSASRTSLQDNAFNNSSYQMKLFIKLLEGASYSDTVETLYNFVESIKSRKLTELEAIGTQYHDFYCKCKTQLLSNSSTREAFDNDPGSIGICIERLVFTKLSEPLMNIVKNTNDDLKFSFKIYNLCWVTESHLEIPNVVSSSPKLTILFCSAQASMRQIGERISPTGKLKALSRSCGQIFNLIQEVDLNTPASADDFFPLLVYTILKTNLPNIHSHIDFINLFCQKSAIETGQCAYYFTSFKCAVEFIDKCEAKSFNVSPSEFQENIKASKSEIELTIEAVNIRLEELAKTRSLLWERITNFRQLFNFGEYV